MLDPDVTQVQNQCKLKAQRDLICLNDILDKSLFNRMAWSATEMGTKDMEMPGRCVALSTTLFLAFVTHLLRFEIGIFLCCFVPQA